jgi:hypothetical protein
VGDGVTVVHAFPPRIVVVHETDGCGDGAEVDVDALTVGTGIDEKPVLRVNVGVGVVLVGEGVGVGVVGTLAVLTPPVIICLVAIGRLGLAAR